MKNLIATLMFAFFTAGFLRGQELPKTESVDQPKTTNYVSVDKTPAGENVLLISYPWRTHAKASVEVRLITDKKDFDARVKPLRFAMVRFDDDTNRRILSTFDEAVDRPSTWKAEAGGLKWEIIGHSNHFGRAATWFVNTPVKDGPHVGITAAFYPPDPWAINDRLLSLDLPRDGFDQPGKLYIWFLRGDRILWQEELVWPGQK
jgi:hypothetical protein